MMRHTKVWWAVAAFTAVNALGAPAAELMGDGAAHTGLHLVLTAVGAFVLWRLTPKRRTESAPPELPPSDDDNRITQLEQSIDAVAIEVERLGEGQRYMTRLIAEDGVPAEPVAKKAPPPNVRRD